MIELGDNCGWHNHAPVQNRQNTDFVNEDQIAERTCIGDDKHSGASVAIRVGGQFGLPLLPQTSAGCTLALEVFYGVFERHTVTLEESVEIVV